MTNSAQDYIKIDWLDVKAGDVLMHNNGDRLTVNNSYYSGICQMIVAHDTARDSVSWGQSDFSPYRRVPDVNAVPTKLGVYLDKDGDVWELEAEDTWALAGSEHIHRSRTIAYLAPFTPLVPMPTEEQVQAAMHAGFRSAAVSGVHIDRASEAVLRLLRGEGGES